MKNHRVENELKTKKSASSTKRRRRKAVARRAKRGIRSQLQGKKGRKEEASSQGLEEDHGAVVPEVAFVALARPVVLAHATLVAVAVVHAEHLGDDRSVKIESLGC